VLSGAEGKIEHNPVLYINLQLRKHFHMTAKELEDLSDEEWAEHFAILQNIRQEELKHSQPST
jgi:diadenosine tetraphosphate (Ap4A) HIT family hydrolase